MLQPVKIDNIFHFSGDETSESLQERKNRAKRAIIGVSEQDDNRMSGNETYDIHHIWDNHQEIIRRIVLGQKNTEIAEAMNCTSQTISNVRNHPIVRKRIEFLQSMANEATVDVQKRIVEVSAEAEMVLEDLMNSTYSAPKLRADIAFGLLDRAGYGPVRNLNVRRQTVPCDQDYVSGLKDKVKKEQKLLRDRSTDVGVEVLEATDSFIEEEAQ